MSATVAGTMIAPGVSRNGRLYTPDLLRKAFTRLSKRIGEGVNPVTMLTHHAAGDDSTHIVGRVTSVTQDTDGTIRFVGRLADTPNAATIETLVDPDDRYLHAVSIRGFWIGDVTTREHGGLVGQSGDDLEIDGLDFTATPGVPSALLEASPGRTPITESAEGVTFVDDTNAAEANKKPYGDVAYADPGYQSDGQKRYPLDTKAHVRAAWSYINQKKNAAQYSGAQLKRIKARIRSAAKKLGVTINAEGWAVEPVAQVTEDYDVSASYGSLRICATNGPITVDICGYGLDPADLELIGQAAMKAATDALAALDPDMDGDIDLPGDEPEGTDDESVQQQPTAEEATMADTEATTEATEGQKPAAATSETTDVQALATAIAEAVAAKINPPNEGAAEQTAAGEQQTTAETSGADILSTLTEAQKADLVAELTKAGQIKPERKGFGFVSETDGEIDTSKAWENRGEVFAAHFGVNRPE